VLFAGTVACVLPVFVCSGYWYHPFYAAFLTLVDSRFCGCPSVISCMLSMLVMLLPVPLYSVVLVPVADTALGR
jgi:hypothetical protein